MKNVTQKFFGINGQKWEWKPAYIVAAWWQPPTIDIWNSKKAAIQLHDKHLALKPLLKIVVYGGLYLVYWQLDFFVFFSKKL